MIDIGRPAWISDGGGGGEGRLRNRVGIRVNGSVPFAAGFFVGEDLLVVLDEKVGEGGGEAGLDDEGGAAGGGALGAEAGEEEGGVLLPCRWARHGMGPLSN